MLHGLGSRTLLIDQSSFFVHKQIQAFADAIICDHGAEDEQAFLFPSHAVAARCVSFFKSQTPATQLQMPLRILDLLPDVDIPKQASDKVGSEFIISAVICLKDQSSIARTFWQHAGDGISSRRAEYCYKAYKNGQLAPKYVHNGQEKLSTLCKGPRRYQKKSAANGKPSSMDEQPDGRDHARYVEERFGRNLDMSMANNAKQAIRKRIAGALTDNMASPDAKNAANPQQRSNRANELSEDDVYLYPSGMSSIFNAHRTLMASRGELKSICFGFPYIDTLKILQKWGPGCLFYGHGSSDDINDLEHRCEQGQRFLGLFCEFPGNPLLRTPDLKRLRLLADRYQFAIVVDETIGNFINVDVLPFADIVVSSLTKVFTGECNVMGGSLVINGQSEYYGRIKATMEIDYEDNYWPEDAVFMERNSRDFISRIHRINTSAEAICKTLSASPIVKDVYYPKSSPTRSFYELCRNKNGGYGGLLSVTFQSTKQAVTFFDRLDTAKGPSLGTNFTLSSPYVILAHYAELDWVKQFGVDADLVRMSVGLEDEDELCAKIDRALVAAANG